MITEHKDSNLNPLWMSFITLLLHVCWTNEKKIKPFLFQIISFKGLSLSSNCRLTNYALWSPPSPTPTPPQKRPIRSPEKLRGVMIYDVNVVFFPNECMKLQICVRAQYICFIANQAVETKWLCLSCFIRKKRWKQKLKWVLPRVCFKETIPL